MKKLFALIIIVCIVMLFALPAIVEAGLFGKIGDYVKGQALGLVFTAAIAFLGTIGVAYQLWGKVVKELYEAIAVILKSIDPEGPGGKTITKDEMEKNIKEIADLYPAVAKAIVVSKKKTT